MLHGRGLLLLILLSAHFLINVAGKTLLIETEDKEETQGAVAEGYKRKAILKFNKSKVLDEPDSGETVPEPEEIRVRVPDSSPEGDDYKGDFSGVPKSWVKKAELLKKKCGNQEEISNFCLKWRNKKW